MGHLAQRYLDPSRSGVYRVTDAAVPRAAAREAGAALAAIDASHGAAAFDALAGALADSAQVLIVSGLDALASSQPREFAAIMAALQSAAEDCRERRAPFFAVVLDPGGAIELPPLYREAARAAES